MLRLPSIKFDIFDDFPFSCASQKIFVVPFPSQKFWSSLIMSTDKINSIRDYHAASGGEDIIGVGVGGEGSCNGIVGGGEVMSVTGAQSVYVGTMTTMRMMMMGRMMTRIRFLIAGGD